MYTLKTMHNQWKGLLLLLGGRKTGVGTVLGPNVISTVGLLTTSTGWVKLRRYLNINHIISKDRMYKFIQERTAKFWSMWF